MSRRADRARRPGRATFSVIIPTVGRPSAAAALASLLPQLEPGDEVIVLRDDSGDFGDGARNSALSRAAGTHLAFLDDDDELLPGALAAMRDFALESPGAIGIFRRHCPHWRDQPDYADLGRTASGNYCVPNAPGRLGRFEAPPDHGGRRGDVAFITRTCELQGPPVFVDQTTQVASPEHNPLRRLRYRVALRTRIRGLIGSRVGDSAARASVAGATVRAIPARRPAAPILSVIVASSSRATFARAVASVVPQLRPGDELLLLREDSANRRDSARNHALARARGSHLVFLDDDEFLPDALATMRRAAAGNPGRVAVFAQGGKARGDGRAGGELDSISTAMVCVPNALGNIGRFLDQLEGRAADGAAFVREAVRLHGEPVWCEERTIVLPHERRTRHWAALRGRLRATSERILAPAAPRELEAADAARDH